MIQYNRGKDRIVPYRDNGLDKAATKAMAVNRVGDFVLAPGISRRCSSRITIISMQRLVHSVTALDHGNGFKHKIRNQMEEERGERERERERESTVL